MEGGASSSSLGGKTTLNRVNKLIDQKWRFIPFLAEFEAAPKEYARSMLWGHVIIDCLQVLSLAVMPEHSWGSAMKIVTEILNFTHIPIYRMGSTAAFIAALVLCLMVTIIYVIFFCYLGARCYFTKRYVAGASTYNSMLFRAFRHTMYLFSSVLFIPILQNFMGLAYRSTTTDSLVWYPGIQKHSWPSDISLVVCIIGCLFHVTVGVCMWSLFAETDPASQHPLARFNTVPDVWYLVFKFVSCVLYDQFWCTDSMMGYGIWMAVASAVVVLHFTLTLPLYKEISLKIRITMLWICFFYALLAISSHIGPVTRFFQKNYHLDLIIFLVTLPFFIFICSKFLCLLRVSKTYKTSFKAMRAGTLSNPIVYFPKNLPRYPHLFTQNRAMLDGIESAGLQEQHHQSVTEDLDPEVEKELVARREYEREERHEEGTDPVWQEIKRRRYALRHYVMPYVDYVMFDSDVELATRFLTHFRFVSPMKVSGYQLRYAAILYIKGLHRFESSGLVHLAYIHFLAEEAMQYSIAINEMQLLERKELSISVSYRLWKLEVDVTKGLQIGISNRLSALSNAKEMHAASLQRVVELWHELMQDSHYGEGKAVESNRALMRTRAVACQDYENLIYSQPGNLEVLCCYAVFCDHLLDDKDMSNQCSQFVRQFVLNREKNRLQGTRIQASLSAAVTQLKLALENSRRSFKAIKDRSAIRTVNVLLIFSVALLIVLLVVVLVMVIVKQKQVTSIQTSIFRLGQIRTLAAQIGWISTQVYNNLQNPSTTTTSATLKLLYAYLFDYSTLYNSIMFGKDARKTEYIDGFLREQTAGIYQKRIYNLWTYFGLSLAAMNDVLSLSNVPTDPSVVIKAEWLANDFPSDMNLAATMAVDTYIVQMHKDLDVLIALGLACLTIAILVEVGMFAILFYGLYYMEGVRSLVFALVSLVPKNEIRLLYRRVLNQHSELDVFMKMTAQEKVHRLIAVAGDPTIFSKSSNRTGLLLRRIFAVVPSGKGDGVFISRAEKQREDHHKAETQEVGSSDGEIELSYAANSAARYSVDDCLEGVDAEGKNEAIHAEVDPEEHESVKDLMTETPERPNSSAKKNDKHSKHRVSIQIATKIEYESVVSEQAYLLSNDKNALERIFTPLSLVLSGSMFSILIAIVVINLIANSKVSNVQDFNKQEVKKHKTFADAIYVISDALLSVASFAVSQEQRYFQRYISAQSNPAWQNFRSQISSLQTSASDAYAEEAFDLQTLYNGLFQITNIVMALLCTGVADTACVTNVPYRQLYLNDFSWGTESTLYMLQVAADMGQYVTFFNVLQGSAIDLTLDAATQKTMAIKILESDILNNYITVFFEKMRKMDTSGQNASKNTTQISTIATIVLSGVGLALVVVEFIYNYKRKRGGRSMRVQALISGFLIAFFLGSIVTSAVTLKWDEKVDIDDSLAMSRGLFNTWTLPCFQVSWNPLMYINTNGAILWNYNMQVLLSTYLVSQLFVDLKNEAHYELNAADTETLVTLKRLPMISTVLMYEATKALPEWAEDVAVFNPAYLNEWTWDFEAEPDYMVTYATYHLVVSRFYSTRAADLQLSNADKIALAKATLVSYRYDNAVRVLYDALLGSDTYLLERFQDADSTATSQLELLLVVAYFAIAQAVIVLLSNVDLFVRYCWNMVSMKHVSTVTVGQDVTKRNADGTPGNESGGKVKSGGIGSPRKEDHRGDGRATSPDSMTPDADLQEDSPGSPGEIGYAAADDVNNIEVKNANQSVTSNVLADQNRSIMENVETSSEHQKNKILMIASFIAVFGILVITALALVMLPIYSAHVLQYEKLIDESSQRRWMVVDTMTTMTRIKLDSSAYGVDSEKLRQKYDEYINLIYGLYFTTSDRAGQSEYAFVDLETKQDTFLFSRNRFYDNQTFLGTGISSSSLDGIQIVTTESVEDTAYKSDPLFCSYSDMTIYMGYYSRGVGLVADGQWPDFLRRCFLYDISVCTDQTYSSASDIFQPLLTGLAQSDIYFINFVHRSGNMYYTMLLVLIVLVIGFVIMMYFCLFTPFIHALLQDDADSRMLIKILPSEVRHRYPVFEEILEGKKITKESNQLHRVMSSMCRMAVFAIEVKTGNVIRFNELAEDMFGYATSDVLGKPVSIFLAENANGKPTLQRAYELLREARSTEPGVAKEMLMQRRNGQLFTASTRFITVKLSTGDRVVVAFMEEVADRMRLTTLKKINHAVFQMHNDAVIHMDSNGTILDANPACTRIFGWETQELLRQNVSMLMPNHIAQYHNDYIKRYMETRVRKRVGNLTLVEGLHRNGSLIRLGLSIREIEPPYPSEPTQFVGYLQDRITERELESANSVADVLSILSPIPLMQVNAKGEVKSLSRSACELLLYKHSDILSHILPVNRVIPDNINGNPQPGFIQRSQMRGPSNAVAVKSNRDTFPAVLTVRQIEYGSGLPPYNIFIGYVSDVSKTLRLEETGRMTYAVMVHSIYPVIVTDKSGLMNFFNDAAAKCFGYSPQAVLGKSYRVLCCDDAEEDEDGTRDWMHSPQHSSFSESIYNRKRLVYAKKQNGTTFPAELVMSEIPPINDNDAAVVIFLRDLTEAIKIQRNYHMSELIDALCPQAIVVVDHFGRIERFSPSGEECFGYHAGEVIGAPIQVLIPGVRTANAGVEDTSRSSIGVSPTDSKASATARRGPSAAALPLVKGDMARIEEMVGRAKSNLLGRHFDTRTLNLMIHTAELDAIFQNGDKSYVLYCENISNDGELREASIFYRSIRSVIDSPLLRVDESGKIVYVNHATATMFGYSSKTGMLGKSVAGLFAKRADGIISRLRQVVREFKEHRTKSGMAQQQDVGGKGDRTESATWSTQAPIRMVVDNEIFPAHTHGGVEQSVSVSVVQVSSFLNGTISFIFYIQECKEKMPEQVAASTNNLLVTLSTLPIFVLDTSGTILHTSQYAVTLLGYDHLENLLGINVQSIVDTNIVRMLDDYAVHLTSHKATQARRSRQQGRKKNGTEFPCEMDMRVVGLETEQPVVLLTLKSLQLEMEKDKTSSVVNTMLELIRIPATITDYKGKIIHVNSQLLQLFGYSEKDADLLIGKDVGILMSENDAKFHHRYIANYFQSRIQYSINNTIVRQARHRNGHAFYVNTTIREVTGVSKDIKETVFVGFMTVAPDPVENDVENKLVTGKPIKKRQEVLTKQSIMPVQHNGRMVRPLEHWMQDEYGIAFALLGKAGEVMRLSRSAERLLGYSTNEANGKPLSEALVVAATVKAEIEHVLEVMSTKSNTQYALSINATSRRGDTLHLSTLWKDLSEYRTKVLKDWTEMPWIICYLHNMSEQLDATHNKLLCDAAVEASRQPTIFMGEDGIVKVFNPAAEKVFGWSTKEVVGNNVQMLMPRKTADVHDRFIQTYLRTNTAHVVNSSREVTARRADGSRFSAMIQVRDVNQPSARFFIGQLEDITVKKRDEVFATMSRLLLKQSNAGLLVFDARNALIMVSPRMVTMLGYDRESHILSQPNIIDQIFTPSTSKVYREFVQPYQRQAESNVSSDTILLQNFESALHSLDESPHKRIAAAPLRLLSGESVVVDVDVHVAMCSEILIGTVVKIYVPKEEDIAQFRNDAMAEGSARYYPHAMCVVGRSGRVERCSVALAEQLGYDDLASMEVVVHQKPFWWLFPSFPSPQGAKDPEDEARIFTNMMQQVAAAVNNSQANSSSQRRSTEEQSSCPVLRARMQDASTVVFMVSKVTPILNANPPAVTRQRHHSDDIGYFVVELQKQSNVDDTMLKEIERLMVPLLQTAPVPMLIADEDGVITHANQPLLTAFDFTEDQLLGHPVNILMPRRIAEVHDRYMREYSLARQTRGLAESRRVTAETRTGIPFPVHVNLRDVTISGSRCFVATITPLSNQSVLREPLPSGSPRNTFSNTSRRF